jgi:hypothetical protein
MISSDQQGRYTRYHIGYKIVRLFRFRARKADAEDELGAFADGWKI